MPNNGSATGDQYGDIQGSGSDTVAATPSSSSSSSSSSGATPADLVATDYSQSCANDSECVAVYQGAVCTSCACPNSAIAKADDPKYLSDYTNRRAMCPSTSSGASCDCALPSAVNCDAATHKCTYPAH